MVTLLILDSWVLMMKSRLCHLRDLRAHVLNVVLNFLHHRPKS